MDWHWWVAQGFAFVGLIFVIISFQQKEAKKLIWLRSIATWFVFTGLFFLGNLSAIIMCGAGVLRNAVALYFTYKPDTKIYWKYASGGVIVALLVILNIIFWKDFYNLLSILLGAFNVFTFMQSTAKRIRFCSIIAEVIAITYYSLLFTPVNIIIEVFGLVSAIVGIIRLDIKRNKKTETSLPEVNENKSEETKADV